VSLVVDVATVLLNGLQQGAIYVLLAVGLSIILGTLKFVNFAHGALYLVGTYLGLFLAIEVSLSGGQLQGTYGLGLGYIPALILVPLIVFVVGLAMERFVAQPFYDRPDTDQILVTFGLAIVVQELFRLLFGASSLPFTQPEWANGTPQLPFLSSVPITTWRYYVIIITAVLVLIVYLLVEYTDFGLVVRAGTRDAEMVRLLGIKIDRPYLLVFGIGAALAGVAGVVGGPLNVVNPTVGTDVLVPAFLTVVIGGVGSIVGAVIGGVIFGMTYSVIIAGWVPFLGPGWAQVGIYAIAAIVLLVRPQGLLGDEEVAP
jgi:branched-chain amino acid transport system permease protein